MKRFLYFTTIIIFVSTFFSYLSYSEVILESKNKYLNETIKEKIRVDLENFVKKLENNQLSSETFDKNAEYPTLNSGETSESIVSADSSPESELSSAINPKDTNNLIVAVMRQTSQSLTVPIYYSKDFGKSWKRSSFAPLPPRSDIYTIGGGDPVCVFDNNGRAHLTWISLSFKLNAQNKIDSVLTAMHYAYSTNGGENWIYDYYNSVSYSSAYSPNMLDISKLQFFDDKQWLAADLDESSPNHNNIYIVLSRFETSVSQGAEIVSNIKKSSDDSFDKNFTQISKKIANAHQFSSNSIAKNGRLLVTFYGGLTSLKNFVYSAYSDDAGKTFSDPVKVSDFTFVNSRLISSSLKDTIIGVDLSRVYPSIYNASDNNKNSKYYGNSYVVWSSYGLGAPSSTGFNVYLSVSTNGGESWNIPIELSKEPLTGEQDQFYPTITVNSEGIVIVSWYEQGADGIKTNTNYVVALSFDGGKTFSKTVNANTVPTNFSTVGSKNNRFGIGEYNQLISTKYYAIPVWCDGRENNGNLNVYAAFIPLIEGNNSVEKIVNFSPNSIDVSIDPNPANETLNCKLANIKSEFSSFKIFDINGKELLNGNITGDSFSVNLSKIQSGTCFIEIENNGIRVVRKFIKN